MASSSGVELTPIGVRNSDEIERDLTAFSGGPNGGLIMTASTSVNLHRDLIIMLAARHKLPAVYPQRFLATSGGLISYGPDPIDYYRPAAGYVDRILKMLWGSSGVLISIAALTNPMEPRHDETQNQECERFQPSPLMFSSQVMASLPSARA